MPSRGLSSGPPAGVGKEGEAARPRDRPTRRWHGRTREHPAADRARTDGRGEPQPAPGDGGRVDAARVRPVEPRPRLRRPRRRSLGARAVAAVADRADGARGQPAHRGQPAELPPRDRPRLRPRQRVGHLGQPVDRRGGPARLLHPRLPPRDPRRRSRRARAGPDGDDGDRLRRRRTSRCSTSARTCRSRSSPPASRTATPAATPRSRSPRSCSPGSPRTRTCT